MNFRQKINFKQLRCFQAVAEHGSFTAAAQALVIGQPSITTHVRALEENFGVELFCRHGHLVELTHAGRALLVVSQRIFSLENEAAEILNTAGGLHGGKLNVGAIEGLTEGLREGLKDGLKLGLKLGLIDGDND